MLENAKLLDIIKDVGNGKINDYIINKPREIINKMADRVLFDNFVELNTIVVH